MNEQAINATKCNQEVGKCQLIHFFWGGEEKVEVD